MKRVTLVCLALFTTACSTHKEQAPLVQAKIITKKVISKPAKVMIEKKEVEIQTLVHISQNSHDYTSNMMYEDLNVSQKKFELSYFKPWNIFDGSELKGNVDWALKTYKVGYSYGENLQLLSQSFFDNMKSNSNFENYSSVNKQAITLGQVNIRALPTDKPLLLDPNKAGEGFPFDYLQNTTIAANKPIFVTHYSKDKEWVHVISSFAYGWIKVNKFAFLQKYQTDLWQKAKQVFILKDDIPIYSSAGDFLFKSRIGMMLALVDEDENSFTVLAVSRYKQSQPLFIKAKLSKNIANKGFIDFNAKNLDKLISELQNSNYGWGGVYGQRDCSSTLKDMFTPFGLWLPRNSYQQSKIGSKISLNGLSGDEKIKLIKEKAIPFKTLLYKKGHIVLYTGIVNNKITIFQNMWGIKTKKEGKEGRFIVGKTIFSTLNLGDNLSTFDDNASLLKNLKSINSFD
ncbi:MAG: SH3 domain-containing protein [Sulfurimonas sp.]